MYECVCVWRLFRIRLFGDERFRYEGSDGFSLSCSECDGDSSPSLSSPEAESHSPATISVPPPSQVEPAPPSYEASLVLLPGRPFRYGQWNSYDVYIDTNLVQSRAWTANMSS